MYQSNSKKVKVYTIDLQMHSIGLSYAEYLFYETHIQYTLGTLAYMLYTALQLALHAHHQSILNLAGDQLQSRILQLDLQ